jgi:hypothetical protein
MNDDTNVEIRKQRRPLRFSGIDSSAPLLRRVGILLHRGGGEKVELSFILQEAQLRAINLEQQNAPLILYIKNADRLS